MGTITLTSGDVRRDWRKMEKSEGVLISVEAKAILDHYMCDPKGFAESFLRWVAAHKPKRMIILMCIKAIV